MSKKVGTLVFAFFLFVLIFEIRYYIAGLTAKKVSGYSPPLTMATLGSSMKPSAMNHPNVVPPKAVPILYYHSVKLEAGNELRMPPDQFEEQMTYLKDNGFESITLEQFYQAQNFGGALPKKPFVITFDDGYADNYTTAFPILKKHGFTAGVFMVTSYINGEGFMSWSQLKELVENGWEIEGHTITHPYLTKENTVTVMSELTCSKELLEKELGCPVNFFAYPYGDYNESVAQIVRNTGYKMAITTERGWANNSDTWNLHRVYCYANMGLNEFSRRLINPNY